MLVHTRCKMFELHFLLFVILSVKVFVQNTSKVILHELDQLVKLQSSYVWEDIDKIFYDYGHYNIHSSNGMDGRNEDKSRK